MKNNFYHKNCKKQKISEFTTKIHKLLKNFNKHKQMNK